MLFSMHVPEFLILAPQSQLEGFKLVFLLPLGKKNVMEAKHFCILKAKVF